MKGLIITGTLLLVVPLAVLWYTRRKRGLVNDLMDEQPVVRRKKETIVGEMEILSSDVRCVFVKHLKVTATDIIRLSEALISRPPPPQLYRCSCGST